MTMIKHAIAAIIAAGTWFFTTRMPDGSMCFFYSSPQSTGVCGAPVLYYLGFVVAALIFFWGLWDWLRGRRQDA